MIITKDGMESYIDPDMVDPQLAPGISNPILHSIISNPEEWASMSLPPPSFLSILNAPPLAQPSQAIPVASSQGKLEHLPEYPKTYIPSQKDQYQKFNNVDNMEKSKLENDSPKERLKLKCSAL